MIQAHAIPLLSNGFDVMASSQTGSGKSIMFCLPLMEKLLLKRFQQRLQLSNKKVDSRRIGSPLALVVSPTRELAMQTQSVLKVLCRHAPPSIKVSLATGGARVKEQRQALADATILVGTPGRILQFADERQLSLSQLEYLVIDEGDRMLDLGFSDQLTRIAKLLRNTPHQSLLCSATFPAGVQRVAADFLRRDYYFVSVGRVGSTHERIRQQFEWADSPRAKEAAISRLVTSFLNENKQKNNKSQPNVIVFVNTKDDAERYGKVLGQSGKKGGNNKNDARCDCRVIHGDKSQTERNNVLRDFKVGRFNTLVATDVAARGLDISTIGLVLQADAPRDLDTYTHRVGRTGRAGAAGQATTLLNGRNTGIANGLVELMHEARQAQHVPAWLLGMAHVAQTRKRDEELELAAAIGAGAPVMTSSGLGSETTDADDINEQFSSQDFRRTASEGSYGAGKDISYRSFDDDAYSDTLVEDSAENESRDRTVTEELLETTNPVEANEEATAAASAPFIRPRPSNQILQRVRNMSGSEIGDDPNNQVVRALSTDQKFRFEYLGLFPFQKVFPLLSKTANERNRNNNGSFNDDRPRILMVAEKPSIAEAIANALSGPRGAQKRQGISRALPVYEFTTTAFGPINNKSGRKKPCVVSVTSVVGHIFSLGFDDDSKEATNGGQEQQQQQQRPRSDPRDFFSLPVVKQEVPTTSKLRVVEHLRALAAKSEHIVLWLDCDAEGENIAHEVLAVTRRALYQGASVANNDDDAMSRIHRARFSAITKPALQDAFASLEEPDAALSWSVDARQELDLRVGVALTRLLSWRCVGLARRSFDPATKLISYGPCQSPTLSFCVDRGREIESFRAKKYVRVLIEATIPGGNKAVELKWRVPQHDQVPDNRGQGLQDTTFVEDNATFDKATAKRITRLALAPSSYVVVREVEETSDSLPPPVGLNTVALLKAGSKAMGMSPKQVMNVAEKLYSAGFISYPRTESTKYDPNGFDVRQALREHASHDEWGRSASFLLRTKYSRSGKPPLRGKDMGDHPPITPLKAASREEVGGGAAWRIYEFIVKTFLGSLHNELSFTRRKVSLELVPPDGQVDLEQPSLQFDLEQVMVDSLGYADCCRWVLNDVGAPKRKDQFVLKEGQKLLVSKARLDECHTRPPRFLQEHELIRLMDENRIGTDASMAIHVSNIVDRRYVVLCDELGDPLRPPMRPRPGSAPRPRQVGRYLVPTALGMSFLQLFESNSDRQNADADNALALLCKPTIRRQMEEEVRQISLGVLKKEDCLKKNLDWFEARFRDLEMSLSSSRLAEFKSGLSPLKQSLKYWRGLNAFEPKPVNGGRHNQKQNKTANARAGHGRKQKAVGKKSNRTRKDVQPRNNNNKKRSQTTRKGSSVGQRPRHYQVA